MRSIATEEKAVPKPQAKKGCDAKIRPFSQASRSEVACEYDDGDGMHGPHRGVLHDYAFPGSETKIDWWESDRRTYHGDWPGACPDCVGPVALPRGHAGSHV